MITRYPARPASSPFASPDIITTFGPAALVRCPDGQVQLEGGGHRERIEAREWISLFRPELVLKPQDAEPKLPTAVGDRNAFGSRQTPARYPSH